MPGTNTKGRCGLVYCAFAAIPISKIIVAASRNVRICRIVCPNRFAQIGLAKSEVDDNAGAATDFAAAEATKSGVIEEEKYGLRSARMRSILFDIASGLGHAGDFANHISEAATEFAWEEKTRGLENPKTLQLLDILAALYKWNGHFDEAVPLYERAVVLKQAVYGNRHPYVAKAMMELAEVREDQGRDGDAARLYEQSLPIMEGAFGSEHAEVEDILARLGKHYFRVDRFADAERLFRRVLALREKASNRKAVTSVLNILALLCDRQGRPSEAFAIVRQLFSEHQAQRTFTLPVLWHAQTAGLISKAQIVTMSYEVVQRDSESGAGEAISRLVERNAAGSDQELAVLIREKQDLAIEELAAFNAYANSILAPHRREGVDGSPEQHWNEVKAKLDQVQAAIDQRMHASGGACCGQPMTLTETQTLLAEDEALVVLDFDLKSHAWIVTRTDADWTELEITADELNEQVRRLREPLVNPDALRTLADLKPFDVRLAYRIYRATFGAISGKLEGKTRLAVVSNAAMLSIPPALLVTSDPSGKPLKEVQWLLYSHAVTIWPSVSSMQLRQRSKASSAPRPLIAFGDPEFKSPNLPRLEGTRAEVLGVAAASGEQKDIRLGADASEAAVKHAALDKYRIVYFATYGLVADEVSDLLAKQAGTPPPIVLEVEGFSFTRDEPEPALALTPGEGEDGFPARK
jgi:tetratricopeptide (TPR) repeat protein